jgi:hypothetical protein
MGLLSERSEGDDEHGDISIAGLDHLDGGADDETVYELDDWSERDRTVLQERLETLGVPHSWEETSLVCAASDEAWVERIMDQVEDDLSLALDPNLEQVAYDLSGWTLLDRDQLFALLEQEAVPYGVEDDELFVHAIDEQRVDAVVESIVSPSAEAGPAGNPELMGEIFVAADRLVHDPADTEGALSMADASRSGEGSNPPYGMDKVWWDSIIGRAGALVALLDVDPIDEDAVEAAATELRDGLRPYV